MAKQPRQRKSVKPPRAKARKPAARRKATAAKRGVRTRSKPKPKPTPTPQSRPPAKSKSSVGGRVKARTTDGVSARRAAGKTRIARADDLRVTERAADREANRSEESTTVRARFTDPLRRFNEHDNIGALIAAQAARHGSKLFLTSEEDGREVSFGELDEMTRRVSNLVRGIGAGDGARAAVLMDNTPECVFALLGIMRAGLIVVPVRTDSDADGIQFALEDSGATLLIVDEHYWPRVEPLLRDLPGLLAVFVSGQSDRLGNYVVRARPADALGDETPVIRLSSALESVDAGPLRFSPPRWWDESALLYTGRDLKQPRGAILQHRQFLTAARWLGVWVRMTDADCVLNVLPLFHVNSLVAGLFAPLTVGARVVLCRGFQVQRVWPVVERLGVSIMVSVPMQLAALADREGAAPTPGSAGVWPAPEESPGAMAETADGTARLSGLARGHRIGSMRMVLCGAAPLPHALARAFEKLFLVPVIEGFSTTETAGFAALSPVDGTRRLGSAGAPVGNKVAILDARRRPPPLEGGWHPTSLARMSPSIFPTAGVGEPGEICVWGENVLKEYFQRPAANPQAFAGGWYHTGDIGCTDADGTVYVLGTPGQEVAVGGRRRMTRDLDEILFSHAAVEYAVCVASGSALAPAVTACVVARPGTFAGGSEDGRIPASEQEESEFVAGLTAWLESALGHAAPPMQFLLAPELPRDATGKSPMPELRRALHGRLVLAPSLEVEG